MEENFKKRSVVLNRVKRVPFVVFLKRILPLLLSIFIIFLSFIFGLWNVKKFDYNISKPKNVTTEELDSYLSVIKGRNIFILNPNEVINTILNSNGFVKEVTVKKILPSTLQINIKEYSPFYIGYSSNRCILFADTGELIKEICKECETGCRRESDTSKMVYINSNSVIESNDRLIFFEEIYKVESLLFEFNYSISTLSIMDGIAIFKDTQEHSFTFDLSNQLEDQLARMYLIGTKINKDMIQYTSLDLRFERPVMNIK